ncbi:MAG: hypothetical protein HOD92_11325 [Deltaproteobacteria bacterium]|jgi:hypothetical protein|nr:hypothetical protein [Deltaproteobacteria bacterium]MBT4526709.1 hypothetical protein [Deltaproteobacteria bacterium]
MKKKTTPNCLDCHFLAKQNDNRQNIISLDKNDRDGLVDIGEKHFKRAKVVKYVVKCAHGCWAGKYNIEFFKNPNCKGLLFYKRDKIMSIDSAKIVQKREEDRKAIKESIGRADKSVKIATYSLWIAAITAAVSIYLNFL